MIWENGIKICIISYKKRIVSPDLMQDTGSFGLVHWEDPERWYGEGGWRAFRMGNACTPMVVACLFMANLIQYCKLKKKKKRRRRRTIIIK